MIRIICKNSLICIIRMFGQQINTRKSPNKQTNKRRLQSVWPRLKIGIMGSSLFILGSLGSGHSQFIES